MNQKAAGRRDRRQDEPDRGDGRSQAAGAAVALTGLAAFVGGFLFGRRRSNGASARTADGVGAELTDAAGQVRQRLVAPVTEAVSADDLSIGSESAEGSPGEAGTSRAGMTGAETSDAERERMREAAADLSAPTVRGMPTLGVRLDDDADFEESVATVRRAVDAGYRHVDAMEQRESYYAEAAVGEAIDDAGVAREDLFLATKVDPADLDFDHVLTSADESLDRLGTDYLDLLYVHWPTDEYDPEDTLDAFAQLREDGVIERVGVSNFTVDLLAEAIEASDAPIFANQVEMHPLCPQTELREFCAQDDVDVELVAYSPIARGAVEDVSELQAVAEKHDATPEQVSLAWLREKGVAAVPRATTEEHLLENWCSLGLELDDEDVATLDSIEERRRVVDPPEAPWNQ